MTRLLGSLRGAGRRIPRIAVEYCHVHPSLVGYRWWKEESVRAHLGRTGRLSSDFQVIHPATRADNPLPANIASREELPDTQGWWGFSFRDVPTRASGETFMATIRDCRIVQYIEDAPGHRFAGDYYVALLTSGGRSLELREVRFRPRHAEILRTGAHRTRRLKRATWIAERVYHNHSHWLTAHVPKLLLLKRSGRLDDLVLPAQLGPAVLRTLALLGLDANSFPRVDVDEVLQVDELTVIGSDRFRPEMLQSVRTAMGRPAAAPGRRIYISRARAARRRLVNEEEIWAILKDASFERVFMEDLSFDDQIELMGQTAVIVAPHGAGLTNMIFCPARAHVVEIADLGFPNPNFYALASALQHRYWLVPAEAVGEGHPLTRNMAAQPDDVLSVIRAVDGDFGAATGQ